MITLNDYNHNMEGIELIRDNGNWNCRGEYYKDHYVVQNSKALPVKRQHWWTSQMGKSEPIEVTHDIEVRDGNLYICDCQVGTLPVDATLKPVHTCQEPRFHEYKYTVDGKEHVYHLDFRTIAEAAADWREFVTKHSEYVFNLTSVSHLA